MNIPERCISKRKDSKIVLEEKDSKVVFYNESRLEIQQIAIDGCAIHEGLRCDFLIVSPTQEIFVELKGSEIDHAVKQIEQTMSLLNTNLRSTMRLCFIISSRCPLLTPKIQQLKLLFKKRYNAALTIKNRYHEHYL